MTAAPGPDGGDRAGSIPAGDRRVTPDRLRFLGHATVLIELDGATLITDPLLRGRVAHLRRHTALPNVALQRVDAVLISHLHQDHLDRPSLNQLGTDVQVIVPVGAARLLGRWGFRRVEELSAGQATSVGGVRVRAVPAVHSGRRVPFGPTAECLGYLIEGRRRVYFAGDTALFSEMAGFGPVHTALLPVWGWGTNLGAGHLNPREAALALTLLRPALAIPVHWGTFYPMGLRGRMRHLLHTPPEDFARHARELAPQVAVRILAPGEALCLPTDAGTA